jgi:tRNA threonylcarbamoyladenosine biosynthesis protein TsaB
MIVGIETSTKAGSIALVDQGALLEEIRFSPNHPDSQTLIPSIQQLLMNHNVLLKDIRSFAVAIGPGSFTGLRVGLTAAKTLAFFNGNSVVLVPTLDALAFPLSNSDSNVTAILDARKGEVYGAIYEMAGRMKRITEYSVGQIEEIMKGKPCGIIIGDALVMYADRIRAAFGDAVTFSEASLWIPKAASVASLALTNRYPEFSGDDLFKIKPLYLRKSEAEVQWDKRH